MKRAALVSLGLLAAGCTTDNDIELSGTFRVVITAVDGLALPTPDDKLPANLGDREEQWDFTIEALTPDGKKDPSFDGWARINVVPGSLSHVVASESSGRNVRLEDGYATGSAFVTAVFGPARLWVEDVGYVPAPDGVTPACANGSDDDEDVLVDHPNDPGCAFADDMSEEAGSLATGVSQPVQYERPTIADVQGRGSETPYVKVSVDIKSETPSYLVVTRVSSNGFFVSDLAEVDTGHAHLFAFNFNTPVGMRVCDRLTVGSSRVDLQACKLEYSIVSPK